jgi:hypothetical protein
MKNTITTQDGFVWLDVTNKSKELFNSKAIELYELYQDEYDSLITTESHLIKALKSGSRIVLEVGHKNEI